MVQYTEKRYLRESKETNTDEWLSMITCVEVTKHSQSYCYCANQEPEMKNRDSREKLTKAQIYCLRREQSIQSYLQENRHVYIGELEKEEERSPTEYVATNF